MSGYPTPPGPRIAYDLDGTLGFVTGLFDGPGMTPVHPRYLRAMNSDSPKNATARVGILRVTAEFSYYLSASDDFPVGHLVALRFPEPMRIRALALATMWGSYSGYLTRANLSILRAVVETSDDSTNGEDGTWRQLYAHTQNDLFPIVSGDPSRADETYGYATYVGQEDVRQEAYPAVNSNYRRQSTGPGEPGWRSVTGSASRQVTWLRIRPYEGDWNGSYYISNPSSPTPIGTGYKLHLYGEPDTAASDDRIIFTDVSGNVKSSFDWGDIGRESEHTQTFKIKNISDTEIATGVSVGIQTPNPSVLESPEVWNKISLDGTTWLSTLTLPDLAPGASSDTITLRVQVGTTVVGPSAPRISADVEEWV